MERRKKLNRPTPYQRKDRLVRQRGSHDCVLASLSMATRIPYSQLKDHYLPNHDFQTRGMTDDQLENIFQQAGFCTKRVKRLYPGKPAILALISLNRKGSWHGVYYNGSKLFDPNTGIPGRYIFTSIDSHSLRYALLFWRK